MKPWISLSISSLAILLALIAIGVTLPVSGELDFDYYGAIVGVLAFLITVLMGYQIYTVINVKEELKEMKNLRDSLYDRFEAQKKAITVEYKQEFDYTLPMFAALIKRDMLEILENALGVFARTSSGSWANGFAEQMLELSMLEMDDKQFGTIADEIVSRITDKEIVTYYNFVIEKEKNGEYPEGEKIRQRLSLLLSKVKVSGYEENI